jgi:acyl dehydratase
MAAPSPVLFSSGDGIRARIGALLGPTEWLPMEQSRITGFAEATGDHQWIHVDAERAAAGPFGATIAHGFLTLSLLPWFWHQLYAWSGARMVVNYGLDYVRFPAAVPVGSRLRATLEVIGVKSIEPAVTQTAFKTVIELDGNAKPACVAITIARQYWPD